LSDLPIPEEDIIVGCASGALILDIGRYDRTQVAEESLVSRCIALHNDGRIDLLSLVDKSQFSALVAHRFFILQNFFCEAIPRLEAPTGQMLRTVEVLVKKGGDDLASNMPNDALRSWLSKDIERAKHVVDMAHAGDEYASRSLAFAVEALGDIELARSIITRFSDKRRLSGMSALGRLKSQDAMQADASASLVLPYISAQYDEETRCNALISIFKICEHYPSLFSNHIPPAVTSSLESSTEATKFALARAIWFFPKMFNKSSLQSALDAFVSVDASKTGIIHDLDYGLAALLDTQHRDIVLHFLETVLSRDESSIELSQFKSVKHKMANEDRNKLFVVVTRWLLTGNHRVSEAATALLRTGEKEKQFDCTTEGLKISDADLAILAHRAIGYLLITNPVVTTSIMVACLRGAGSAIAAEIGELLFDPILINYGGSPRDYLRTIKRGDRAYKQVRRALKLSDTHFTGLDIKDPIKELRPSDYQRSAERTRRRDMMRQVRKDANKQSILANLVHRSTLLHGRKSMTFVPGPDDELRPMVMDLHSFGTSFEVPLMEILDPVGLDLTLFSCRIAGSRK
jgi:hypothetical protein